MFTFGAITNVSVGTGLNVTQAGETMNVSCRNAQWTFRCLGLDSDDQDKSNCSLQHLDSHVTRSFPLCVGVSCVCARSYVKCVSIIVKFLSTFNTLYRNVMHFLQLVLWFFFSFATIFILIFSLSCNYVFSIRFVDCLFYHISLFRQKCLFNSKWRFVDRW